MSQPHKFESPGSSGGESKPNETTQQGIHRIEKAGSKLVGGSTRALEKIREGKFSLAQVIPVDPKNAKDEVAQLWQSAQPALEVMDRLKYKKKQGDTTLEDHRAFPLYVDTVIRDPETGLILGKLRAGQSVHIVDCKRMKEIGNTAYIKIHTPLDDKGAEEIREKLRTSSNPQAEVHKIFTDNDADFVYIDVGAIMPLIYPKKS